jgi:hypothetical protein
MAFSIGFCPTQCALRWTQELPLDSFRASELPDPEELVSARRAKLQEAKVAAGAQGV